MAMTGSTVLMAGNPKPETRNSKLSAQVNLI
jgi:hypothetical protein